MAKWWETLGTGLPELGTSLAWGRENRRKKREETKTIPNPYAGGPPIEVTVDQQDLLNAGQPAAGLGYNRVPFIRAQDLPLAKTAADLEYLTKGTVGGVKPPADVAMENAAKAAAAENSGRFGFGARTQYTPAGETGFKPIPKLEGLRLTEGGQVFGPGPTKEVLLGTTAPITQRTMTPEEILNQKIAAIIAQGEQTRKTKGTPGAGGHGSGIEGFNMKLLDPAAASYNQKRAANPDMPIEQFNAAFAQEQGLDLTKANGKKAMDYITGKAFEKKGGVQATDSEKDARRRKAELYLSIYDSQVAMGIPDEMAKSAAKQKSGAWDADVDELIRGGK